MITQDTRYEGSFQPYSDMEPYEFCSADLGQVKNWIADKIISFPSPASAMILDHGTEGSPVLFREVN